MKLAQFFFTDFINGLEELGCKLLLAAWCVEEGEVERGEVGPLDCGFQHTRRLHSVCMHLRSYCVSGTWLYVRMAGASLAVSTTVVAILSEAIIFRFCSVVLHCSRVRSVY